MTVFRDRMDGNRDDVVDYPKKPKEKRLKGSTELKRESTRIAMRKNEHK